MNREKTYNHTHKTVLFVETGMGFGGSAVSLKEIVHNLKNYKPYVVFYAKESQYFSQHFSGIPKRFMDLRFTYKQKEALKNTINRLTENKTIERVSLRLFAYTSYIFDQLAIFKLSKIIKRKNIAIVHINNGFDPIALKAAIRCSVPCIIHSRGHDYVPPKQKYVNYISKLIAPTKKIADHDRDHLNVPSKKIQIVHDTIDIDYFSNNESRDAIRESYDIDEDTIVIGMFARIIPMKGQLVLIKAIERIIDMKRPIACLFVGDTSDYGSDYLTELRSYIDKHFKKTKFIFAGYQNDTASFYSATDIVVHPSIDEEAFGRIIIEAWAAKKPIVASDIGASIELIDHEKTGLIVKTNNSEDLASAIKRLIHDKRLAQMLSEAGTRQSLQYGNGPLIEAIEKTYKEILFT